MCQGCSDARSVLSLPAPTIWSLRSVCADATLDWLCGTPAPSAATVTAPLLSSLESSALITSLIELRI